MSLHFVILHHTGIAPPHFDFMFEMEPEALLTTFRCLTWPPAVGDVWEELAEHRRAYLTYEGPVSGDRGHVRRIDAGTLNHVVLAAEPPTLGLTMEGSNARSIAIAHRFDADSTTRWVVQSVG